MPSEAARSPATSGSVLLTLAAGQFLMALDSSVMNVSIASVAKDVGTTVTGIQGAITAYTLVMAMFMIPGGKVGVLIGRKRAFMIGCCIYGCGSFTTALAPNLTVLLIGWSLLEGIGAALILPAIVALVAGNFASERRPAAYGLVAAASAVAIAVGPIIGGIATTYFSWRWVFAGEVVGVLAVLAFARRLADAPTETGHHIDLVGAVLSAAGLGSFVYGVLRSSEWGWFLPKPGAPAWLGVSLVVWLMLAGLLLVRVFLSWEDRLVQRHQEPILDPALLRNRQLTGGLTMFFFQYLVQMGVFFLVPLYLSIALGLSALATGARLLPLSLTLLAAAILIPGCARRPHRAGSSAWASWPCSPEPWSSWRRSTPERERRRHRAAPADRPRCGGTGLPARRGHRLRRTGREERGGRRRAERRHQPRCLHRNSTGRLDPHRHPERLVPDQHRAEPEPASRGREQRHRQARERHPVPVRPPAPQRPRQGRHQSGGGAGRDRREQRGKDRRPACGARRPRPHRSARPVLHQADPGLPDGLGLPTA